MSMKLSVYVGPFLRCDPSVREMIEMEWEHLVYDGLGEPGRELYLIPNRKVPGITRETTIDGPISLVLSHSVESEISVFKLFAERLLRKLSLLGKNHAVLWGVVSRYM